MRTVKMLLIAVVALALVVPAAAQAGNYPPAGNPGKGKNKRSAKAKTFTVCKQKRCKYRTINRAVAKASGGDLIRVRKGTYREGVKVTGSRYDGLRIVGDTRKPGRVVIDNKRLKGAAAQNSVLVNSADRVTVSGLKVRNYKGNGVFFVNVDGYTASDLIAAGPGVYGVYAFNSKGGTIKDSVAYEHNDAGFYIGQTPKQAKPKRSIVTNVKAYRNVLGFSGTNMRYVTIKNSQWFNNGTGIVPSSLKSERFPPPQENVISGNEVFWNNYNYYAGAKFRIPRTGPAGLAGYPLGVGILLFGGQGHTVERNKIYGNWLVGYGAIEQLTLLGEKSPALKEAAVLRRNVVRNNDFGLGGRDLNGRDMFYDGTGTQNCFSGNTLRSPNLPLDNGTFAACPAPAANTRNAAAQGEAIGWIAGVSAKDPNSFEKYWVRHPHAARKGIKPLVRTK